MSFSILLSAASHKNETISQKTGSSSVDIPTHNNIHSHLGQTQALHGSREREEKPPSLFAPRSDRISSPFD